MNQSPVVEAQLKINFHHWLQNPNSETKLQLGQTAYLVLEDAFRSIAARIYLIRKAQYYIDLQYYIWANDFIGNLMLSELLQAADRNVKVRLLIDDQNGRRLDPQLQALLQHTNIQIKLYNPYKFRKLRIFDYIFRAKKINRRMHNKLIIADGTIAVTGGRNISGEYFDASQSFQFTDTDVLFLGQVMNQANQNFLLFWNHSLSVDLQHYLPTGNAQDLVKLREEFEFYSQKNKQTENKVEAEHNTLVGKIKNSQFNWANTEFLADIPDKTLNKVATEQLLYTQLINKMGKAHQELDLISAYFVPTASGLNYLCQLPKQNVQVRILTNAFVANDVALVHAFYQKYRYDLLKSGIKLYEFKPYIERNDRTWYEIMTGNVIPAKVKSKSSLHSKLINIDNMTFIGSFNFDPRSAHLNTEVGLLIQSEQLQQDISTNLDQSLSKIAYQLKLNEQDDIVWLEHQSNGVVIEHAVDPGSTRFQRFMMHSVAYLPIEWMM